MDILFTYGVKWLQWNCYYRISTTYIYQKMEFKQPIFHDIVHQFKTQTDSI